MSEQGAILGFLLFAREAQTDAERQAVQLDRFSRLRRRGAG
jgi:hypothetical protein